MSSKLIGFLLSICISIFLFLAPVSFAGEKEGINYADRWTSEVNPSTLCLKVEQYELLNMGQFLDEEGRLLVAMLLQVTGTETKIVIVQYMDTQEVWLVTYEEGKKIYALDKKNNIYLEWDTEKRCFKQKSL
jgi:hypothetical protein